MKCQQVLLSIFGAVPYPFPRYSIVIYHVYSFVVLVIILLLTYIRYIFSEYFPDEFGVIGTSKLSDILIMLFILSTALVHFVLQLDSTLKCQQYFKLVETVEQITKRVKVSRKCIILEMSYIVLLILGIQVSYKYVKIEGIRGIIHLRITWSEICCRMKILQYSLYVEMIDGCLSKALSRLSNLKHFGDSKSSKATKEFVDIQNYVRRINDFENQIFKYLGSSLVVSFAFETCTFTILMYISTMVFTDWNEKNGEFCVILFSHMGSK